MSEIIFHNYCDLRYLLLKEISRSGYRRSKSHPRPRVPGTVDRHTLALCPLKSLNSLGWGEGRRVLEIYTDRLTGIETFFPREEGEKK